MADPSATHDVLSSSSTELTEVSCAEEDMMDSTTTFLVQDDGGQFRYAYLVQLDDSEAAAEGGDGSATLAMAYYQQPTPVCLDDEQASAAANLLEFNQQVYILPEHAGTEHHLQLTAQTNITAEQAVNRYVQVPQPTHDVGPINKLPKPMKTYGKKSAPSTGVSKELTAPAEQGSSHNPLTSITNSELIEQIEFATPEIANEPEMKPNIALLTKTANVPKVVNSKIVKTYGKKSAVAVVPVPPPTPVPIAVKLENPTQVPPPPLPVPPQLPIATFRRKRKLIVDIVKVIPHAEFRKQLTAPVTTNAELPPPKKARLFQNPSTVGSLFAFPGRKIGSSRLSHLFIGHLRIRAEIPTVPVPSAGGLLEPLDPDLRTSDIAFTTTLEDGFVSSLSSYLSQQRAESFDVLVKGMGKSRALSSQKPGKKPSFLSTIKRQPMKFYTQHPLNNVLKVECDTGPLLVCKREAGSDPLLDSVGPTAEGELIISDLHDDAQEEFIYTTDTQGENVYYIQHDENGTEHQEQECVDQESVDAQCGVNDKAYNTGDIPPVLFMD